MTDRREFPAKIKAQAFQRAAGRCEKCDAHLYVGKIHYDHVIPDAMGGEPMLWNCEVLCIACHSVKTRTKDVPQIAKVKRVATKHVGIKKPPAFRKPDGVRFDWKLRRYVPEKESVR